jgi:hypothetical protein
MWEETWKMRGLSSFAGDSPSQPGFRAFRFFVQSLEFTESGVRNPETRDLKPESRDEERVYDSLR